MAEGTEKEEIRIQPRVGRVVLVCGLWYVFLLGHFFAFGKISQVVGDRITLPEGLQAADQASIYAVSNWVATIFMVGWVVFVLLTYWPLWKVLKWVSLKADAAFFSEQVPAPTSSPLNQGTKAMIPLILIAGFCLLMSGMSSPTKPDSKSGLQLADSQRFSTVLELFLQLSALVVVLVLFAGMFAASAIFQKLKWDSGCWFVAAILIGVVAMILFSVAVSPVVDKVPKILTPAGAIAAFFAMVMVGGCWPVLRWVRS